MAAVLSRQPRARKLLLRVLLVGQETVAHLCPVAGVAVRLRSDKTMGLTGGTAGMVLLHPLQVLVLLVVAVAVADNTLILLVVLVGLVVAVMLVTLLTKMAVTAQTIRAVAVAVRLRLLARAPI